MIKSTIINNNNISYCIERKQVKNINIRIKSDGIVYISANKNISEKMILSVLEQKIDFIIKSLKNIQKQKNTLNDKIKYLGNFYDLKIDISSENKLIFNENKFILLIDDKNDLDKMRLIVKKWYLCQSIALLEKINQDVRYRFLHFKAVLPKTTITVKEMKTRWGSCSPMKAKISMNLRLMEYPIECIYAVLFHEYTHYYFYNHSSKFYELLQKVFPDYKKWNKVLND